jgi:hypothetical protein
VENKEEEMEAREKEVGRKETVKRMQKRRKIKGKDRRGMRLRRRIRRRYEYVEFEVVSH